MYIPLPDAKSRAALLRHLLRTIRHSIRPADFDQLAARTNGAHCTTSITLVLCRVLIADLCLKLFSQCNNAGYSGSDLTQLGAHSACRCCTGAAGRSPLRTHSLSIGTQIAKDAALGPVRELGPRIRDAPAESLRPVSLADFASALNRVRPSVSPESLTAMETWSRKYGSFQGRRLRNGGKGNLVRVLAFILSSVMIAYLHLHRLMMRVKGMYKNVH